MWTVGCGVRLSYLFANTATLCGLVEDVTKTQRQRDQATITGADGNAGPLTRPIMQYLLTAARSTVTARTMLQLVHAGVIIQLL